MSTKTYCDRCGRECTSRRGHLHLTEMSMTNKAEVVSADDYRPVDLCDHCIDATKAFIGPAMVIFRHEFDGPDSEAMAVRAVPAPPFYPPDAPVPG